MYDRDPRAHEKGSSYEGSQETWYRAKKHQEGKTLEKTGNLMQQWRGRREQAFKEIGDGDLEEDVKRRCQHGKKEKDETALRGGSFPQQRRKRKKDRGHGFEAPGGRAGSFVTFSPQRRMQRH